MKVRYTETALVEIEELFAYVAERNRRAANLVLDRTWQTIAALADFPELAAKTDMPGVRLRQIGNFPYLVYYTVEGGDVVILHVRHAARPRPWEGEP
jgi:toxin ParE1/3/4